METKSIRLDLNHKRGQKQLEKLLADGWVIASQQVRGLLQTWPRQTDLVLTRQR